MAATLAGRYWPEAAHPASQDASWTTELLSWTGIQQGNPAPPSLSRYQGIPPSTAAGTIAFLARAPTVLPFRIPEYPASEAASDGDGTESTRDGTGRACQAPPHPTVYTDASATCPADPDFSRAGGGLVWVNGPPHPPEGADPPQLREQGGWHMGATVIEWGSGGP